MTHRMLILVVYVGVFSVRDCDDVINQVKLHAVGNLKCLKSFDQKYESPIPSDSVGV